MKMFFHNYQYIRYIGADFRKIILIGSILFNIFSCYSQISQGGFPLSENFSSDNALRSTQNSSEIPFIEMPTFDKKEMIREDSLLGNDINGMRFAYKFNVTISPKKDGIKTILPDGTQVWRIGIRSKEAFSLNLLFSKFRLPSGAKVFIYSPDRTHILGAFTEANNQTNGLLPTAPIDGDELIIEYEEPSDVLFSGEIEIGEVNHDYRGLRTLQALPSFQSSASCEIDVSCNPIHPEQRRSSCLILVDGTNYCSGNLVNNVSEDGTPFLLSAAHCLFNSNYNVVKSKAERSVFFFNYESPHCSSGIQGSMEMSIAGATVQSLDAERDMLLLRLNEMPPVDYRPYYAGWNATSEVSGPAYCFHHPSGDVKKISIEYDTPLMATFTSNGLFLRNGHWRVYQWEEGISEGGSSGSGLFDSENRIIGNLSGGATNISCSNPGDDNFYRLSVVWETENPETGLKSWLDPQNTGYSLWNGKEPYNNPCVRISNWKDEEKAENISTVNGYVAGHNNQNITEFAEKFSNKKGGTLFGVYFSPQQGIYSTSAPVKVRIYSGDTVPENLLHEEIIKITNTYYQSSSNSFTDKVLYSYIQKENYFRLKNPVEVDSSFFIAFKLSETVEDTFALYHTTTRSADGLNTAWFKYGNEWKSFSENPIISEPASLMVDAVIQFSEITDIKEIESYSEKTKIFPNPTSNELTVLFPINEQPVEIRLNDLSGRTLFSDKNFFESYYTLYTDKFCSKGIFFLHIIYSKHKEILKFIKQ